jgi:hypothetical protein
MASHMDQGRRSGAAEHGIQGRPPSDIGLLTYEVRALREMVAQLIELVDRFARLYFERRYPHGSGPNPWRSRRP